MIQIHPEFLAAVQDAETYEAAIACAKGQGWPASTVVNSDLAAVIQSIAKVRAPAVVVADVDGLPNAAAVVAQLVSVCAGRSKILVIGSSNDVAFYRAMIQAGAVDYLLKPVNSVTLRDAIVPLLTSAKSPSSSSDSNKNRQGKVYAMIGVRGGVGASTIAVNTAWIIAHQLGQKVALIDLDLQYGNCDLALDLVPPRGLRELLFNPNRMDALLINSAMAKDSESLSVFCCEESLEEIVDFDTGGPIELIETLRKDYDAIIIDMPRLLLPKHRRMLVSADQIFLVSDLTLSGVRDVPRIKSALSNLGTSVPVHVLAGRIGDGAPQLPRATFEHGIKARVAELIPHDTVSANLAASKGKSIASVASSTQLVAAYRKVVKLMTGEMPEGSQSSGGFMSKLFGSKG